MCDPIIRISGYVPTLAATTDLLQLFGDPTRVRLLALLARHQLTVAELTAITGSWRSRASRRTSASCARPGCCAIVAPGASTLYALNDGAMPRGGAQAVDAARRASSTTRCSQPIAAALRGDAARPRRRAPAGPTRWRARWSATTRRDAPGRRRRARSSASCSSATCSTPARATARSPQLLAPRARSITCLDRSERVLGRARARASPRVPTRALPARRPAGHSRRVTRASTRCCCSTCSRHARQPGARDRRGGARAAARRWARARHARRARARRRDRPRTATCTPGFAAAAGEAACWRRPGSPSMPARSRRASAAQPHFQVVTAFARKPTTAR